MFDVHAAIDLQAQKPPGMIPDIPTLVNFLVPLLFIGAAIIFLFTLLYGAFMVITAEGNPENIKKAQKLLTYAVIGLVIVVLSYFIVSLIKTLLNISTPLPI